MQNKARIPVFYAQKAPMKELPISAQRFACSELCRQTDSAQSRRQKVENGKLRRKIALREMGMPRARPRAFKGREEGHRMRRLATVRTRGKRHRGYSASSAVRATGASTAGAASAAPFGVPKKNFA